MATIEIYTTPGCPYCHHAKALLQQKGAPYRETDIAGQPALRDAMVARAGGRTTVPQIFIDDRHIGGCDDLYALDERGGLDPLLRASP